MSPSNDIDKFWHYHILDAKSYYAYCIDKFNKIIHHNPIDSFDKKSRFDRIANTYIQYLNKFGSNGNKQVWNISYNNNNLLKPNSINPNLSNKKIYWTKNWTSYC